MGSDDLERMTAVTSSDGSNPDRPVVTSADVADRASRRWRTLWRIHFYSGMIAMPFILLMALTGLVILYTQPIQDLTQGDLRTVSDTGDWGSFDAMEQAVEKAYPDHGVVSLTLPADGEHSASFGLDNDHAVFVNPYTGGVLGDADPGDGIVGLSNRLHGMLNNDTVTVSLPSVGFVWDDGPVMREYVVGDLVLELLGVWVVVLAASGLYLWWPRKSRHAGTTKNGRTLFGLRLGKKGRGRWRDLHAMGGVLMSIVLLVTLASGMAWSTYWGPNFSALAEELTPNDFIDPPASSVGTRGDLDRLGNKIPWNTGAIPIPASYATDANGELPAPISLDSVVAIGTEEGMKPGYAIYFPDNSTVDDAGNPIYGSFTLSNSWPRKTGEARDLFIDQFDGNTLDEMTGWGYGTISYAVDATVSWHMGTQWGVVTRVLMTMMCLLAIWAVISGFVMFWKRRRPGSAGLPRRPREVKFGWGLWVIIGGLAIVYPLWGVTAAIILLVDRFVIRTVPRLRAAFGQR
ncbi:MAG: PepSY domain-containing protein [Actinobacteria bacterium]|nr:PepSY domain-containing protein [Actinomycetota bacterium]